MTTAAPPATSYDKLCAHLRETALLHATESTLAWDQETMMPRKGSAMRADQLAQLATMVHARRTSNELADLLSECEHDDALTSDPRASANLREVRRELDRESRLPAELVTEISRTSALGMEAWKEARAKQDFSLFEPWLQKTFDLARRKAECLKTDDHPELYDALMDGFEPGMTSARTEEVFAPLREFTVNLLKDVRGRAQVDATPAIIELPIDKQIDFTTKVLEAIGYDFDAGRMDPSTHPFCEGLGPGDTRITNRYRADGWTDALSSGMHEGGHALYEQGLPKADFFGQPIASAISLGIHESQSRLWENQVGRSRPFWGWALEQAKQVFGAGTLGGVSAEALYKAANMIEPNFIRVESDELTYNLHIMLRFDFERALIDERLKVGDLPGEWNARIKNDLGLDVPNDAKGCLQDIHWSMGAVGYFATYTFGNIYAAQLWATMGEALPTRDEQMVRGEFGQILAWLRTNVHELGMQHRAEDLCKNICGEGMNPQPLMDHLQAKVDAVYG
ncbi:MAG: carboxypeptidase M32 [Planctomycetota bacterium]